MPSIRRVVLFICCVSLLGAPMLGAASPAPDDRADLTGSVGGAANGAPTADAGPDLAVAVAKTVVLNGTGSFDPDGDRISYKSMRW